MKNFRVTIERTELIEFTVLAENANDAEERALMDGDEVNSRTTDLKVVLVEDEA